MLVLAGGDPFGQLEHTMLPREMHTKVWRRKKEGSRGSGRLELWEPLEEGWDRKQGAGGKDRADVKC